ncbi:hypothetical protein LGM71_19255 [Burkholderia sp. AU33545]|uniref:hypothetical protein n=1 Tax=Burkholderia sp. AU33545 TaxID=2879631 RepID=UPI001CF0E052|nr:hypothetical protein [Burkholderia sp. AU33545]MCA8203193.1 hypothetical protein [Burkholderia sp. AU33545]
MSTFNSATATVIKATANGATTAGPISIPGLQIGDCLVSVSPFGFPPGFAFESAVSVADQLQQEQNLDWSGETFTFYLLRGV